MAITGNPNNYPTAMYRPSDGSPPKASEVNPALEALGDRTAFLKARQDKIETRTSKLPLLNWHRAEANNMTVGSTALYTPKGRAWIACGSTQTVRSSVNGGLSWSGTLVSGSNENTTAGDVDPDGNMVIATETRYAFAFNASTETFTRVDVHGATLALPGSRVVYDPVRGRWVWFTCFGALSVRHSTDRSAWTLGTPPAPGFGWGDGMFLLRMVCKKSTGRIVAIASLGSEFLVCTSDTGGASWVIRSPLDYYTAASRASLVYNEAKDEWIFTAGETTGVPSGVVYRSVDDGVTWTLVSTQTTSVIHSVAVFGAHLVGMATVRVVPVHQDELVWSDDGGVTWRLAGFNPGGQSAGVFAGQGSLVIPVVDALYTSSRVGTPDLGVIT
ncbi:MAG: exo-alpha-sialidase [Labilithrix sp.]|nr:exo-alpha-sialidase [Labilithrix sp.]